MESPQSERQTLDGSPDETNIANCCKACAFLSDVEHRRRHVEADHNALFADGVSREEHVDAAAATQIQHTVAGTKDSGGRRAPTAETGGNRRNRQPIEFS